MLLCPSVCSRLAVLRTRYTASTAAVLRASLRCAQDSCGTSSLRSFSSVPPETTLLADSTTGFSLLISPIACFVRDSIQPRSSLPLSSRVPRSLACSVCVCYVQGVCFCVTISGPWTRCSRSRVSRTLLPEPVLLQSSPLVFPSDQLIFRYQ